MTSSETTARLDSGAASALIALVAGAVALGFSAIFVRLAAAEGIGPFASAFWRVALSLPVLYGWMRLEEAQGPKPRKAFGRATLLAGLAFAGDLFFWHLAILDTTVANATFFATTAPVFFGLYFLAVERARDGAGAGRVTFEASVVTAVVLLPVAVALEPAILPGSAAGWLALIALAWVSHAGGQGLLSVALGRLPATFSSLVIFLEAVATAAFGWIILGERVTLTQGLGGALILGGIYVARPRNGVVPG